MKPKLIPAAALAVLLLALSAAPAGAAPFVVDDLDDTEDADFPGPFDGTCDAVGADTCTLRAAVAEANAAVDADQITVSVPGTIVLSSFLGIQQLTTLTGHPGGTTLQRTGSGRVIVTGESNIALEKLTVTGGTTVDDNGAGILSSSAQLTLNEVTVTGNQVSTPSGGAAGGGIATLTSADALVLNDSTVSGNTITGISGLGGGIRVAGPLTLNRSTVSGNSTTLDAGGRGGGIDANFGTPAAVAISNSTISGNHTGGGGGGGVFATNGATVTIVGSTIAGNDTTGDAGGVKLFGPSTSENSIYAGNAGVGNPSCNVAFTAPENNIDTGTDCGFGTSNGNQENVSAGALGLGALASNGGPTKTHAIASGSVAQNVASADCGGLAVDQRGIARPQGAACDIGAFELVPAVASQDPAATPPEQGPRKRCKKGRKLKKGKCIKKKRKGRK